MYTPSHFDMPSTESMHDVMEEDKVKTREIVKKMTQIYRSMAQQYNEKIEKYEGEVAAQELQKKQLKEEIASLQTEKEKMITDFETQIFLLKQRIDTMSSDFASMLKTTYKKMQERIDSANNNTNEADYQGRGAEGGYGGGAAGNFGSDDAAPGI